MKLSTILYLSASICWAASFVCQAVGSTQADCEASGAAAGLLIAGLIVASREKRDEV